MKSGVSIITIHNKFVFVFFVLSVSLIAQSSLDSLELYDPFTQTEKVRRIIKSEFSTLGREYSEKVLEYSDEIHRAADTDYAVKAWANIRIGDIYFRSSDYNRALSYYFTALRLYEKGGDSLMAAFVKLKLGRVHYFADIDPAIDYYSEAGSVLKSSSDNFLLSYYYYISAINGKSADERAEYLQKATAMQERLVMEHPQNKDYHSALASSYNLAGRYDLAVKSAEKSGDNWLLVLLLNNQGARMVREGSYQQALRVFQRSVALSKEGRFKTLLRNGFENTSRVYRLMGDHRKSTVYMQLMILVMESLYLEQINSQISEMRVKYESEKKELENKYLKTESERLSQIADAEKNLNKLLAALTLIIAAALGVVYVGNRKLKKMNAQLDTRNAEILRKQEELSSLNKILTESEKNLKDAQATAHLANWEMDFAAKSVTYSDQFPSIFRGVYIEPGMQAFEKIIPALCHKEDAPRLRRFLDAGQELLNIREMEFRIIPDHTVHWIRIKKFIRKNENGEVIKMYGTVQDITEQKIEEENKIKIAEQKSYTRQLIGHQEEERKKIAGELHDGLGQDLLLIKNRALLALQNQQIDSFAYTQINEISATASTVLDTLRAISFDLRPVHIERIGLAEVLKGTAERLRQASQKNIVCDVDDISGLFSVESEVNLFRIYQEALNNIIKYSDALDVYMGLHKREDYVHILIRDNGRGFDYEKTMKESEGFGLRSIINRAEFVRGAILINTSPGNGTVIDISVPFEVK
ncbi:MAG: hypothetical protein FMNOHCHN_01898 [Ignavibacteriaceae bacterium]|nr:hypothetical protein [Ignavibacteriaceae bacterium]